MGRRRVGEAQGGPRLETYRKRNQARIREGVAVLLLFFSWEGKPAQASGAVRRLLPNIEGQWGQGELRRAPASRDRAVWLPEEHGHACRWRSGRKRGSYHPQDGAWLLAEGKRGCLDEDAHGPRGSDLFDNPRQRNRRTGSGKMARQHAFRLQRI